MIVKWNESEVVIERNVPVERYKYEDFITSLRSDYVIEGNDNDMFTMLLL